MLYVQHSPSEDRLLSAKPARTQLLWLVLHKATATLSSFLQSTATRPHSHSLSSHSNSSHMHFSAVITSNVSVIPAVMPFLFLVLFLLLDCYSGRQKRPPKRRTDNITDWTRLDHVYDYPGRLNFVSVHKDWRKTRHQWTELIAGPNGPPITAGRDTSGDSHQVYRLLGH